jgi:hypothetical protein
MADISAFPTKKVLTSGDLSLIQTPMGPTRKYKAAAAIKAGQIVIYGATAGEVTPAVGALTERVCGYCADDYDSGDDVLVWMPGNIVRVVNFSTTVAIAQGVWLQTNDNAVLGTVNEIDLTEGATATQNVNIVGYAIEPIAVSSYGYAFLSTPIITVPPS